MDGVERRFRALDFLLDYSRGTLWWVSDDIWKEAYDGFVVKRKGHPGLSLARRSVTGLYDTIPMLIGTTKRKGRSIEIREITDPADCGPRVTHFSLLRPCPIRFDAFGNPTSVCQNTYKPKIDADEFKQLERFVKGGF